MSRTAASSAADPTESYAPGKSHEISRCTPCPASVLKEDDTRCYARGARVPHASTEKPHGPDPIAHTGTSRRRIIQYYAESRDAQQHARCGPLWRPWSIGPGPSTLEERREAAVHEYLYGVDRRPRNHEGAYVPRLAYIVQRLRDLARLRRVRDRIDREYA